jgi:carbonic anhydrase
MKIELNKTLSAYLLIVFACACTSRKPYTTPLEKLLSGNNRYTTEHPLHPHQTLKRLKDVSKEQIPFAIVVTCSDSRTPPEILFDQGIGDLFVIRTAGNVIGEYELASIEYAIENTKCQLVLVLGHEGCGAVKIFIEHPNDSLPGHLNSIIEFLKKQPYAEKILNDSSNNKHYIAVVNNILYEVNLLKEQLNTATKIDIVGALYHLDNGKVHILANTTKN